MKTLPNQRLYQESPSSIKDGYFISRDGRTDGPFTVAQMRALFQSDLVKADDLCARDGDSNWKTIQQVVGAEKTYSSFTGFGWYFVVGGGFGLAFFLFIFDTAVYTSLGRIVNLSLLSQRQNGVIASAACLIVGAVFLAIGSFKTDR